MQIIYLSHIFRDIDYLLVILGIIVFDFIWIQ